MAEPILTHRSFVLAEDEEGYLVIDRRQGQPVERFPLTQQGFEEARAEYEARKRQDRRERSVLPRWVWLTVVSASVTWVITGVGIDILEKRVSEEGPIPALDAIRWIDHGVYRLAIAGVLVLLGTFAVERIRHGRTGPSMSGRVRESEWRLSLLDRFLVAVFSIGVAAWTVGGLLTEIILAGRPNLLFDETDESSLFRFFFLVSSSGFRIWIAAAVGLAMRWMLSGQREPVETPTSE